MNKTVKLLLSEFIHNNNMDALLKEQSAPNCEAIREHKPSFSCPLPFKFRNHAVKTAALPLTKGHVSARLHSVASGNIKEQRLAPLNLKSPSLSLSSSYPVCRVAHPAQTDISFHLCEPRAAKERQQSTAIPEASENASLLL